MVTAGGGVATATVPGALDNTPWTSPVRPALCTTAQIATGNVAGCLLDGPDGRPETRGFPTPPFPDATGAVSWTTVGPGASGEIVRRIQTALGQKGVPTAVDSTYGTQTQTAVTTFQQKQGLPATGSVDTSTAIALGVYTTSTGQLQPWTNLQKGSSGDAVRRVQQALNANGANPQLNVDGIFGNGTETAVKNYQGSHGLAVTGIVDEAMANMLGVRTYSGGFPDGWRWSGWGFNGSFALIGWESQFIGNATKIGPVGVGAVKSLPATQPLFEGFVRDIVAGGYKINDIGGFVFRCTSNSRKDCQGLDRDSLSNHSYGLAVDINTGANPEIRYATCAEPLKIDFPQWVVQTAEKWGLYWGGYGWGKGCASSSDTSTNIIRDTMHFEFRGTVAQAQAIAAFNGGGVVVPPSEPEPLCTDYVDDLGKLTDKCFDGTRPAAGSRLVVDTDAPADASAALVNITVAEPAAAGYVTAEPCAAVPAGDRSSSNGNYAAGQTVANVSVVPVDSKGWFCVYTSAAAQVIVDVQGYLTPSGGSLLNVVEPKRVVDTRTGQACYGDTCAQVGPIPAGQIQKVTVADESISGIAAATAVLTNLTITEPAAAGYLTADACSTLVAGEQVRSNANYSAGATVANLAVVPADAVDSGVALCTYADKRANSIVDVQGYFAPAAIGGLGLTSQQGERVLDTRTGERPAAASITAVQGPPNAAAVLVNLTLTGSAGAGYATADRCSTMTVGEQTKSNGNFAAGRTVANLAVVPLDEDGRFCIYNSAAVNLIVDIQGALSADGGMQFQPITPLRKLDTRQS